MFSLCGLNCGLCPMNLNQYCPGCGGGEGNQSCSIAKCSFQHGITHQCQKQHIEKFKKLGIKLYSAEQQRKKVLLNHLLDTYNDGRKKTLFCVAVNLLELEDLENIINDLDKNTLNYSLKEKAAYAANLFRETAAARNIALKLRRKK